MAYKIANIQVVNHNRFSDWAQNQHEKQVTVEGGRGEIYDRNNVQLAMNLETASYGLRCKTIKNIDETVSLLADATDISSQKIRSMIAEGKNFQWLIRKADRSTMQRLDRLNLECIEKFPELKRYYPNGMVASQIIGWTDVDGKGIEGCEYFLNDTLTGRNGQSIVYRDAKQRITPTLEEPMIKPLDGSDIVLTIDSVIQEIAEDELVNGISQWNAISGGVIVMNTNTGEILAMANAPRFDANESSNFESSNFDPKYRKNRLITDMMEPGSTFKIVAFIEGLESGVINESDEIDCENGKFSIGKHIVNDSHELGVVPLSDVFIHSSNIGTVKIAEKIGAKKLYERARQLGYGEVTGFDFPVESPGILENPRTWSKLSLPTISFGQGIAASPLQVCVSYAAIANGGYILTPRIIKEIRHSDGIPEYVMEINKIRQAMTVRTANRMKNLLYQVVESGSGVNAAIRNVRIGGKTGTAQIPSEDHKGYVPGRYISSFIGFTLDGDPGILCYVIIDSPKKVHYGSQVAAPIFKNIMNRIINYNESPWNKVFVENSANKHRVSTIVPELKNKRVTDAISKLTKIGLNPVVIGDSTLVLNQFPLAGAELDYGSDVAIYSDTIVNIDSNKATMPNLIGKTMREAIQYLVQANLDVKVDGTGIVSKQTPDPGKQIDYGTVCIIACNKKVQ